MKGRDLVVVVINDEDIAPRVDAGGAIKDENSYGRAEIQRLRVGGGAGRDCAISSWKDAMRFWADLAAGVVPDLIFADIRFRDASSPLRLAMNGELDLPTGLSHLKPLAAIARALGRPIGVGLFTSSQDLWKTIWETDPSREASNGHTTGLHAMALLAAQETGELAAILGSPFEVSEHASEDTLRACWSWIRTNSATGSQRDALDVAVVNYRHRLLQLTSCSGKRFPQIIVPPATWAELRAWCRRMQQQPRPLRTEDGDASLEILLPSGEHDVIRMSSLFADARVDHETDALAGECFNLEFKTDNPERLNAKGLPAIGAFVERLYPIRHAYPGTLQALTKFDVEPGPTVTISMRLGDVLPDSGAWSAQARSLAVFFQLVRRAHENFKRWERALQEESWDFEKSRFAEGQTAARKATLWAAAESVLTEIKKLPAEYIDETDRDEWVDVAEIAEREIVEVAEPATVAKLSSDIAGKRSVADPVVMARSGRESGMKWVCDNVLVPCGVLVRSADGRYRLQADGSLSVPPVPSKPPKGLVLVNPEMDEEQPESSGRSSNRPAHWDTAASYLRDVFGYGTRWTTGKMDDNSIGRFVARAVGHLNHKGEADPASGRDFIDRFEEGKGPEWLKEICREYAKAESPAGLGWINQSTWPASISPTVQS